jgi:myo-inositol-1(or 4)-monophosphatase
MNIKKVAIQAIQEAGAVLRKLYNKEAKFEMKNKHDILTVADLESEKIIINKIKKYFHDHSILSEEKGEEKNNSEFLWIIDPLDGTINFSRNIDEFCISIAVEQNGQLILGLIFEPLKNNLYLAEKDMGAFLNGKRISVSCENEAINSILATDNSSKIETRQKNYSILSNICADVRHIRILGSGALHLAKIASGKIDSYYKTKFNYWDYAAGILLIQEAGGIVTDFQGNKINKLSKDIIASNKELNAEITQLLNRTQ